jgi:Flp pilus assembly protein TadG
MKMRRILKAITGAKRFRSDARGSIGVMFALGALPVAGFAAASLDYNRVSNLRAQLQASADAAALAGAVRPVSERNAAGLSIFDANASDVRGLSGVTIARTGTSSSNAAQYTVNARARVPSLLAGIIGQPNIDVTVTATAQVEVEQAAGGWRRRLLHTSGHG